eukprot:scaffold1744_cov340-Prasinococcus_capsulatus_cf.AAC.6
MDGEDTLSAMGYVSSSFMRRLTSTPESSPLLDQFYSLANPDAEGGDPLTVDLQALDSQSFTSNLLGPQHQAIVQGDADGCVHDFIVEASLDYDGRPLGAVSVSVALPSAADAPTFTTSAVLLVYEYVQLEGGEDYEMDLLASCNASAMVNTESGSGLVSVAVAYEQLDVFSMKLQWDDFVLQHDSAIDASAFMEMDITRNVYSTCVEHNVQQVRVVQQLDRTSMLTTVLGAGDSLHIGSDVTVDTMSKRQSTTCPSMLDEQWMNVLTLTTDTSVETHEINGQGTFTLGGSGADEQGMYTFDYQGMYDTEAIGPQHWGNITLACDVRANETDSYADYDMYDHSYLSSQVQGDLRAEADVGYMFSVHDLMQQPMEIMMLVRQFNYTWQPAGDISVFHPHKQLEESLQASTWFGLFPPAASSEYHAGYLLDYVITHKLSADSGMDSDSHQHIGVDVYEARSIDTGVSGTDYGMRIPAT